jgi:hypothetical protein
MPLWLHTTTDKAQHLVEQTSNSETAQINILWYENEINFNGIFYCFTRCKRHLWFDSRLYYSDLKTYKFGAQLI